MADLPFDIKLEKRLRDLAGEVVFPSTPAIASVVTQSVATAKRPAESPIRLDRPRYIFWAAAALILIATAIAAIPTTRHAVARWFDVPGIHISWLDDERSLDAQSEIRLGLGSNVSIDEAVDTAGFEIKLPTSPSAATPDEVFFHPSSMNGLVSFVYYGSDDLPAVSDTDVGLLIIQFEADPESVWADKRLYEGDQLEVVHFDGVEALWIADTHIISIQPEGTGEITAPLTRSTGSVLIWNQGGVTYRIEGNLSQAEMIEIAESMEPIAP